MGQIITFPFCARASSPRPARPSYSVLAGADVSPWGDDRALASLRLEELGRLVESRRTGGTLDADAFMVPVIDHVIWRLSESGHHLGADAPSVATVAAEAAALLPDAPIAAATVRESLTARPHWGAQGLGNRLLLAPDERASLGILTIRAATPRARARAAHG